MPAGSMSVAIGVSHLMRNDAHGQSSRGGHIRKVHAQFANYSLLAARTGQQPAIALAGFDSSRRYAPRVSTL